MTKEVSFPNQAAWISRALVVIRRDAMDWRDRRGRKVANPKTNRKMDNI
jgi:hypothetical protein